VVDDEAPVAQPLALALAVLFGSLVASALVSWLARRRLAAGERAAARRAVAGVRRANLAMALPLAALVIGAFELGVLLLGIHALLGLAVVQRRFAVLRVRPAYRLAQLGSSLLAYAGLALFLALARDL
jgi:uncharacterized membrane protein